MDNATFHAGELALQQRAGAYERLAEAGPRVIRDHMPEQHREFFGLLPFLLAGSVDADGQPWASVLAGPPGFVQSPDPKQLTVQALAHPHDPLARTLAPGMPIGLLGIQPHTRRRNRLNGRVSALHAQGFAVQVLQSFGNCPKYIQAREPGYVPLAEAVRPPQDMARLDAAARALVGRADTFYIATAHPDAARAPAARALGVDVSHRGGKPGFVRVSDDGARLSAPDFLGNFFFNTLGNLALQPRCGLLFIDPDSGDLLQVAARGSVQWEGEAVAAFAGAQRLVHFEVVSARRLPGALALRWGAAQPSPLLAATGQWEGAAGTR